MGYLISATGRTVATVDPASHLIAVLIARWLRPCISEAAAVGDARKSLMADLHDLEGDRRPAGAVMLRSGR